MIFFSVLLLLLVYAVRHVRHVLAQTRQATPLSLLTQPTPIRIQMKVDGVYCIQLQLLESIAIQLLHQSTLNIPKMMRVVILGQGYLLIALVTILLMKRHAININAIAFAVPLLFDMRYNSFNLLTALVIVVVRIFTL